MIWPLQNNQWQKQKAQLQQSTVHTSLYLMGTWHYYDRRYSDSQRQPKLTTLAVASQIASQPTSSSSLLSKLPRAAIGNFCSYVELITYIVP